MFPAIASGLIELIVLGFSSKEKVGLLFLLGSSRM
jgi:hypothetical protein